jgi:hypothetical protein
MQKMMGALAAAVCAAACIAVGAAQSPSPMPLPKCSAPSGPLVWYFPSTKTYYPIKYKVGPGGTAMCSSAAIAQGGHAAAGPMSSPMPMNSMGPASRSQGGTMPGAGGQVPNNPASTPNVTPIPQPT